MLSAVKLVQSSLLNSKLKLGSLLCQQNPFKMASNASTELGPQQVYDFILVLDFEATCAKSYQINPQVSPTFKREYL